MKTAYLALSVPNKQGQQIFATLDDQIDGKDRFKVYSPRNREYWRESEIQTALTNARQDLEQEGYTVQVVDISEYHGVASRRKKQ